MNFSQYAGVAIVPTLSRVVLGVVFLFNGYLKLFTHAEFEATADGTGAANKLHRLGVPLSAKTPVTTAQWMGAGGVQVVLAAYRQNGAGAPPVDPPPSDGDDSTATTTPTTPPAPPPSIAAAPVLAPGIYTTHTLHGITVLVHDKTSWPLPVVQGWMAALTEFIGGALLLIGMFSRVWGVALAIVMAVAFYLTSLPMLQGASWAAMQPQQLTTLFLQVSLFVLALGIVLTGPGPLSFDRFLLERRPVPPPPKTGRREID